MKPPKPTVVIDTQVWVFIMTQCIMNDPELPPYQQILAALENEEFRPVYSMRTIKELTYTLTRSPEVVKQYQIDPAKAAAFVQAVTDTGLGAVIVAIPNPVPAVSHHRPDDKFIATAIAGSVQYLVTEDVDFRTTAVLALLKKHGIEVIFPTEFRAILERFAGEGESA